MIVDLTEGMTPAQQVQAIQAAFDTRDIDASAVLEDSRIVIRHNQYGDDFEITVNSDQAAGDSGFDNVPSESTGVDLKGTINGVEADVEGDVLVGKNGFAFEDLRVRVPMTSSETQARSPQRQSRLLILGARDFVNFGGVLGTRIQSFDSTISR